MIPNLGNCDIDMKKLSFKKSNKAVNDKVLANMYFLKFKNLIYY